MLLERWCRVVYAGDFWSSRVLGYTGVVCVHVRVRVRVRACMCMCMCMQSERWWRRLVLKDVVDALGVWPGAAVPLLEASR